MRKFMLLLRDLVRCDGGLPRCPDDVYGLGPDPKRASEIFVAAPVLQEQSPARCVSRVVRLSEVSSARTPMSRMPAWMRKSAAARRSLRCGLSSIDLIIASRSASESSSEIRASLAWKRSFGIFEFNSPRSVGSRSFGTI